MSRCEVPASLKQYSQSRLQRFVNSTTSFFRLMQECPVRSAKPDDSHFETHPGRLLIRKYGNFPQGREKLQADRALKIDQIRSRAWSQQAALAPQPSKLKRSHLSPDSPVCRQ